MAFYGSQSTKTVQYLADITQFYGELEPILNVGGQTSNLALVIANDVMNAICALPFPQKWNEMILPVFYTNSYQQDYALVYPAGMTGNLSITSVAASAIGAAVYTGVINNGALNAFVGLPFLVTGCTNSVNNGVFICTESSSASLTLQNANAVVETGSSGAAVSAAPSVNNLSWLERGIVVDVNNTANPKPFRRIETGRQLPQATGTLWNSATSDPLFTVNFFPNYMLYFGVWGVVQNPVAAIPGQGIGNGLLGNNPVANSVYTQPLGPQSQPANPITQIIDANGNFLLLTTYGSEGSAAPLAPVNATPGTVVSGSGATTAWTVIDPQGYGIRILPVPSQTGVVWEFNIVGQMKPVKFTSLTQTLAPLPDELEPHFRQGFVAQLYRYSPEAKVAAKFQREWQLWLASLMSLRVKQDREQEENSFVPQRSVMGGIRRRNFWYGPAWPFNNPSN